MRSYKFKVKCTFSGTVEARGKNRAHAKQMIEKYWGAVGPNYQTSASSDSKNEEGIVDWKMDVHSEKKIS